ncbi:MAG TPA: YggT family protein [Gemmatimonadales bacterium]|jgi:YggT family protein|nr:YggT family protein [Gemmatimonadales bacterium]
MTVVAMLILAGRVAVVLALAYAAVVALTHWAVRSRRLTPFGAWPRLVRRASDPVLQPLERRIVRSGGSPQDAPLWLIGIVVVGGLLVISLIQWLAGLTVTLRYLAEAGPEAWGRFLVSGLFSILMIALFVRVISSWLGVSPYKRWMRPVMLLTDWLINPIRRILPPFGMLDFSPLVAWLVLSLVRGFVLSLF